MTILVPKPSRVARLERWIPFNGLSLGTITNGRLSLRQTSADLRIRLSDIPLTIAETVAILPGTITIPRPGKVPLAIGACKSPMA